MYRVRRRVELGASQRRPTHTRTSSTPAAAASCHRTGWFERTNSAVETARDQRDAGVQPLLEFDLPGELGIRDAVLLEGLGFRFRRAARDKLFDLLLGFMAQIEQVAFREAAFLEDLPESLAGATQAWLNAASVRSIS